MSRVMGLSFGCYFTIPQQISISSQQQPWLWVPLPSFSVQLYFLCSQEVRTSCYGNTECSLNAFHGLVFKAH